MRIPLTGLGGKHIAIIDDDDKGLVGGLTWFAVRRRRIIYAAANVRIPGKKPTCVYMHRLICPEIRMVDHRNRNGLDNRRDNLREASHTTNGQNSAKRVSSPSPFKGIQYCPNKGRRTGRKWKARITHNGREIHLGYFATADEAAGAYDRAAKNLFGEYARTNNLGGPEWSTDE